jgi:nucleoid-associated protein YgaU
MPAPDPTSRYRDQATVTVPAPGGGTRVLGTPRVAPAPPGGGAAHEVRPGDRLDLLARALLGDSTQWWRIADANPVADATLLEEPGRTIDLPGG